MRSRRERITFTGSDGSELSGKVELPSGEVRGVAVFAHCFTCSSDSAAASRISVALAESGLAVMRFDFTGLGRSDGDFADTNFSTNVADLVAATDYLCSRFGAPGLLIGHSLGGAAVIAAAAELPAVRAVATIGAPSSPEHVTRLFADGLFTLERDGEAEVNIGGRPFTVRQQLVADLQARTLDDALSRLGAALLVMHSPVDDIVSVDNAAEIYAAARHPKSFVSLDGADHLLTDRRDSAYAASMIRTWAERYLDPVPEPETDEPVGVLVSEIGEGTFLNQVIAGQHRLLIDEPTSVGGSDEGPNPYQLIAAALGGCTSITMRMYAERKKLPLERAEVEVVHSRSHRRDSGDVVDSDEAAAPEIDRWERRVHLTGDLTDVQISALLRIADRCPVHRTLERSSEVVTTLVD